MCVSAHFIGVFANFSRFIAFSRIFLRFLFANMPAFRIFAIMVKKRYNHKYQDAGRRDKDPYYRFYASPVTLEKARDAILDEVIVKRRFLESTITAAEVAKIIDVSSRTFSATMTTHFHTCFRDWINRYRCEYAMTLLRDRRSKDMNMEDIRQVCGFNSRQAFYKAFYRCTGITPLQYRKVES